MSPARRGAFVDDWRARGGVREAMRAEAGWRRRAALMRALFPAAAAGLAAALVGWPLLVGGGDGPRAAAPTPAAALGAAAPGAGRRAEALAPRFESVDSARRPYVVTAESAWRPVAGDRVHLVRPDARLATPADGAMTVAAATGVLDRRRETLRLEGGVDVRVESGLALRAGAAVFDMRSGEARTTAGPVRGEGPRWRLDAADCAYASEERRLRCGGRPTLALHPAQREGGGR